MSGHNVRSENSQADNGRECPENVQRPACILCPDLVFCPVVCLQVTRHLAIYYIAQRVLHLTDLSPRHLFLTRSNGHLSARFFRIDVEEESGKDSFFLLCTFSLVQSFIYCQCACVSVCLPSCQYVS